MPIIEKMIVHNLNLKGNRPIYSEGLINLESLDHRDDALEFFKEHIRNNRLQGHTKICKFSDSQANHVKTSINEMSNLYSNPREDYSFDELFKRKSIVITDHLANSMRGKSSSDGSIFIFLYTYEESRFLGLLKMDPNLGIQVNDDLTLTVRPSMLPSTKEKLHKSAFIKFQSQFITDEAHLFVLDRQQTQDEPAKYFLRDFLQAIEKANSSNLTTAIEREIKVEICGRIEDPRIVSEFSSRLKTTLIHADRFNLDEDLPLLIRGLLPDGFAIEESIRVIKNKVVAKFPDAIFEFVPDPLKVKDLIYKSEDQNVTIKIHSAIDERLFTYTKDEEGNTIFKFSPALNVIPKS
ncbi:hypothetical protein QOZ98_001348 [Planomicrobium stackebrandtii]|uniref:Nucleoid-associated protein n=1 Tax=Planomicrobium stackebrandtii TaxID=253160 RepID=A0ABU0GT43_9BACL|nr:nucleoid-associated protein [Planomicrobium stackebrandtii]MDQ0428522.1 hypothetical protein [Planomicrobium stackebrandtii]